MTFEEMAGCERFWGGSSGAPVPSDRRASDVAHYLDTQGPPDVPTVLVGHSMGGKVAMHLALTQPQRVAALVVVDIAPVKCGAPAKEDDLELTSPSGFGPSIAPSCTSVHPLSHSTQWRRANTTTCLGP